MNLRYSFLISFSFFINLFIIAQTWPIRQADDPDHFYIVNCEFGEIHPAGGLPPHSYPDHFHKAIDINIESNVAVRPIESGSVIEKGSMSVTVGSYYVNERWQRKTKYLHIIPEVNHGAQVIENVTILGRSNADSHLHLEMSEWDGIQYVTVHPLENNYNWNLTLPPCHADAYPPQINDIIVEELKIK